MADVSKDQQNGYKLFICYRALDCMGTCGRLWDRLHPLYSRENIYRDVNMPHGMLYPSEIISFIEKADALIVLIGRHWLMIPDEDFPRKLDNPEDPLRIEIETALRLKKLVIPVYVEGASRLKAHQLPETLKDVAERRSLEIRDTDFDADFEVLTKSVNDSIHLTRMAAEQERARIEQIRQLELEAERKERERQKAIQDEMARAAQAKSSPSVEQGAGKIYIPKDIPKIYIGVPYSNISRMRLKRIARKERSKTGPIKGMPFICVLLGVVATTIMILCLISN